MFTWGVEEFVIRPCLFSYAFKTYSPSLFCLRTRDQGKSDYTWAKMQLPSPSRDWMSVSTLVRFQSKGHIPWSFLTFYLLRALLLQLILLVSVVTYPHNCISLLIHYGPGYRSLRFLIYVPEAIEDNLFSRVTRRAPLRFLVLEIYRRWKVVLRLRGEESSRTDLAPRERCCLVKHVEPNMFGTSLFSNDPITLSTLSSFCCDVGLILEASTSCATFARPCEQPKHCMVSSSAFWMTSV